MPLKIFSVYSPEFKNQVLFPIMEEGKVVGTTMLPREEAEKMVKEIDESKKDIANTGSSSSTGGTMGVALIILVLGIALYFLEKQGI